MNNLTLPSVVPGKLSPCTRWQGTPRRLSDCDAEDASTLSMTAPILTTERSDPYFRSVRMPSVYSSCCKRVICRVIEGIQRHGLPLQRIHSCLLLLLLLIGHKQRWWCSASRLRLYEALFWFPLDLMKNKHTIRDFAQGKETCYLTDCAYKMVGAVQSRRPGSAGTSRLILVVNHWHSKLCCQIWSELFSVFYWKEKNFLDVRIGSRLGSVCKIKHRALLFLAQTMVHLQKRKSGTSSS